MLAAVTPTSVISGNDPVPCWVTLIATPASTSTASVVTPFTAFVIVTRFHIEVALKSVKALIFAAIFVATCVAVSANKTSTLIPVVEIAGAVSYTLTASPTVNPWAVAVVTSTVLEASLTADTMVLSKISDNAGILGVMPLNILPALDVKLYI